MQFSELQKSLDKGETTIVVSLDISVAFDCVRQNGQAGKIQSLGIEGDLVVRTRHYPLFERKNSQRPYKLKVHFRTIHKGQRIARQGPQDFGVKCSFQRPVETSP